MARSVSEYFLTNYTRCQIEESFLASWKGLAYIAHSIGGVAIPIHLLTTWIILTKTPKNMMSTKWILLNCHTWCSLYDMVLSTFVTPYYFFPSMSGLSVGLFQAMGIHIVYQLVFGFGIAYIAMISMLLLFENRSSLIIENRFKFKRTSTRVLFISTNFAFDAIISIPFLFMIPISQEEGKLNTLRMIPCPTEEFFLPETFVLTDSPNTIGLIVCLAGILICAFYIQLFFFAFCCFYYLHLKPSAQASFQTQKLQRRFFVFLMFQTSVPTVFFGVPIAIGTLLTLFGWLKQMYVNGSVIVFAAHGIAESLTVLLIYYPYRNYLKKLFRMKNRIEIEKSHAHTTVSANRVVFKIVPPNMSQAAFRYLYFF